MVVSQGDGNTPLKAGGTSSHSDQSSNSSGCSQVLQYFSDLSDGLPISATLNPATGIGEGYQVLVSSAYPSAASASSLITGGNSLISGNPTIQQSMNMKADSVTSTGAASMGLPTSPLSFSSSNVSLAGSSGLSNSSLSHSGMTPITRLEAIKDPSVHPMKLLKTETGYQPMPCGGLQYDANNFGITCQGVSPNVGVRLAHQLKGQGSIGLGQEFLNNEQQLAQLHASMSAAKALRSDYLQQQAAPNRFQRSNSLLSAQLPRHDVPQQQPQHAQAQFLQRHLLHQEQIMRMLPPQMQRSHVLQQQHHLQQLQHQIAGLTKQTENTSLGACSRLLMQYMHHQRMRPADNNIGFWRKFISEYFAPHSRRRWCLSQCSAGGGGCQSNGVFPQDLWRCEICGSSPGRGFEATVEVMPRLCKTKFDNGDLEELLFVDLPYEYRLSSGLMVLEYNKAIQESVYEQLRVVWEGQLRIIFTAELKILSWDFCAKSHEELFPRRTIVPQVNQLVTIASKYQSAMAQSNGIGLSAQDLQASCNMFVSSARQLTKSLEPPCVNELGFTKRFVRCIQIAEVVNSMKDLIDFSRENNLSPIESLSKYPHRRLSAEVPSFLRQCDSMGMEPFVTEQNPTPNPLQSNINDQGNTLSRPESDCTSLLQSQLLRQRSGSLQISAQIDPSFVEIPTAATGSLVNSLQASPTSSLSSYQTSVSSLTANSQPAVTAFQNHLASNSRNMNLLQQSCLQHIQSNNQSTNSAVQHFLQGVMSPQSSAGQRNTGNIGMNRNPEEMPCGLVRGMSGINTTNIRVNVSGMGGISGGANIGRGSGVNVALRSVGNNLSHVGNMGMHGSRLNLVPLASQQEMHSQDDSLKQGLGLGANNSNSEGTINWK